MAYVQGYDFDAFISYSHVDNLRADPLVARGWIDHFHDALKVKLAQLVGRIDAVALWRDPALDGNELFDAVLEQRLAGAAVMIVLCSPGYLRSDYCRQEREWFERRRAAAGGLRVGERSRIANVLLYNIPHAQWPAQLAGSAGFPFCERRAADDLGEPFEPGSAPFRAAIGKLATALIGTFDELRTPAPAAAAVPSATPSAAAPVDVFLAEVSDRQRTLQRRLAADLRHMNLSVLSGVPPPHAAAEHDAAIAAALATAQISVHLLDDLAGAPVAGDTDDSYPRRQIALAQRSGAAQLIWVPPQLEVAAIEDETQRAFIAGLETAERGATHYQYVRCPHAELAQEVERELARRRQAVAAPTAPLALLLDTHLKDQGLALEVGRHLLERDIQPFVNPEDDDPRHNLRTLQERLQQVQGLIVFFGRVSEQWVRARLAEAINIAVADGCPLKFCGVFIGPPAQDKHADRISLPFMKLHLIDGRQGVDAGVLDGVLGEFRSVAR